MDPETDHPAHAVVIGAGIGGLCAAARLCAAGFNVKVIERHRHAGGKIRTLGSQAGPVDAGPTVFTLKSVFEDVFAVLGARLEDHIKLHRLPLLARHFWPDGSQLDLTDNLDVNREAVRDFAGAQAAQAFSKFDMGSQALFESFQVPMMQTAEPSIAELGWAVLRRPALWRTMAPMHSLATDLKRRFADPRLAQLFGRYATYVGGSPLRSPALLGLIWRAEASGVWQVNGGLHQLPATLVQLCCDHGATFHFGCDVSQIHQHGGRVSGIQTRAGEHYPADVILFNGDPRAFGQGVFGSQFSHVAPQAQGSERSLSAVVWSFAARSHGVDLAHHNVFFSADGQREFEELQAGKFPTEPTIYICAQDRGPAAAKPPGHERFEIILNAPPLGSLHPPDMEYRKCLTRTFDTLRQFGLSFDPLPEPETLTRPQEFEAMFPASCGSLYGQSPHGLMAALKRPRARTPIRGLYLVGGGTHPGAGMPMAALSAKHAVEMILKDHALRSTSPQTAMPGGISTGSAPISPGPSRS